MQDIEFTAILLEDSKSESTIYITTGLLAYRGYLYSLIFMGRDCLQHTARLPAAAKHIHTRLI